VDGELFALVRKGIGGARVLAVQLVTACAYQSMSPYRYGDGGGDINH